MANLTERAEAGTLKGIWFLADNGEGGHEYGLAGSYKQEPQMAFMPACKAMYGLSALIYSRGLMDL